MKLGWLLSLATVVAASTASGCAAGSAEAPLTIPLGLDRTATVKSLHDHHFCEKRGSPPGKLETYPRCDRPGPEWGESWVSARYASDGKLLELRRYERFSEPDRAVERWNQLVGARQKLTPASEEALIDARDIFLEPGTKSVKAFRIDADTVVGVFLLTPSPPEDASILEAVVHVPTRK